MPAPEAYTSGTVTVAKHDDLIRLVEGVNYLENAGVTNGMPNFGFQLRGGGPGQGGQGAQNPANQELTRCSHRGRTAASISRRWIAMPRRTTGRSGAASAVLRSESGGRRTVGIRQGEAGRDPWGPCRRRSVVRAAAAARPAGERAEGRIRHSRHVDLLDRRAVGVNPTPATATSGSRRSFPERAKASSRRSACSGESARRWAFRSTDGRRPPPYYWRAFFYLVAMSITRNAETDAEPRCVPTVRPARGRTGLCGVPHGARCSRTM